MPAPSNYEKRIITMFDSFSKTVIRNFSRNLERADENRDKHFSEEPVDYLLDLLSHEDRYPSDDFVLYADELSPQFRYITPLPKKPSYYMTQYGVNYNPEWPIRVNVDHILGDEENLSRLPAAIRNTRNLPMFLETVVELARRKAVVEPSIVQCH